MDYLASFVQWYPIEVVVDGPPPEVLDRIEARILRSGYRPPVKQRRAGVSAIYQKANSLKSFLGLTEVRTIKVVVSPEGENCTRLTIQANNKAKQDAECVSREEFRCDRKLGSYRVPSFLSSTREEIKAQPGYR